MPGDIAESDTECLQGREVLTLEEVMDVLEEIERSLEHIIQLLDLALGEGEE